MKEQQENRLWDYIDGLLNQEECAEIERLIHHDQEALKFLKQIRMLKARLEELPPEKPSAGFTMNVLGAWAAENGHAEVKTAPGDAWVIKLIAGIFLGVICALVGLLIFIGAGHQARHFTEGLAHTGSSEIIHFFGNKIVTRSLLVGESLILLILADRFFKRFTLKHENA